MDQIKKYIFEEFDTLIGLGTRWLLNAVVYPALPWLKFLNFALYPVLSFGLIKLIKRAGLQQKVLDIFNEDKKHLSALRDAIQRAKAVKFKELTDEQAKEIDDDFNKAVDDMFRR